MFRQDFSSILKADLVESGVFTPSGVVIFAYFAIAVDDGLANQLNAPQMAASLIQPRIRERGPAFIAKITASAPVDRKSILLVEEHGAIAELISAFLEDYVPSLAILGAVQNLDEARSVCQDIRPDVIVFEPLLSGVTPLDVVRNLGMFCPGAGLIAFTRCDFPELIAEMRNSGVSGVITHRQSLVEFVEALLAVCNGGMCLGDERAHSSPISCLTAREKIVVGLVAEGLSTKEIALRMEISVKTVEKFRQRAMDKLNLHDAVSVARYAIRSGLSSI